VFPISLPPLRRRTDDLPLLASFFLERVAKRLGTPLAPFTRADLARLAAWSWPGNVRELQNVVERAAILARDGVPNLEAALPEAAGGAGTPAAPVEGEAPASEAIEEVERAHIVAVLRRTAWVVEGTRGAAAILQLHPNTLRSRMKRLGIVRDDG
jgi:transcriptional regulator with GAF, ATPase, and Fis domain